MLKNHKSTSCLTNVSSFGETVVVFALVGCDIGLEGKSLGSEKNPEWKEKKIKPLKRGAPYF